MGDFSKLNRQVLHMPSIMYKYICIRNIYFSPSAEAYFLLRTDWKSSLIAISRCNCAVRCFPKRAEKPHKKLALCCQTLICIYFCSITPPLHCCTPGQRPDQKKCLPQKLNGDFLGFMLNNLEFLWKNL